MTIRVRRWILVGASLIVFLLAFATVWYELTFYERAYAWLTRGKTKAEVLKRFGKHGNIEACRSAPTWDGRPVDTSSLPCVEQSEYFSRIQIGEWDVGFDKNGKVVSKGYSSHP